MRHSTIDLTMNVYTDARLLDLHSAVEALPELSLAGLDTKMKTAKATGTDAVAATALVPVLVPAPDNPRLFQSIADKVAARIDEDQETESDDVSVGPVNRKEPLTTRVNGSHKERATGLEPATSSLGGQRIDVSRLLATGCCTLQTL